MQNEQDINIITPTDVLEDEPSNTKHIVDAKVALAHQLLEEAVTLLERVRRLLNMETVAASGEGEEEVLEDDDEAGEGRVVEGIFDGQRMIGPDGRHYSVPANYASKSKLIEGDLLKLVITARGAFVYKQIGPSPRRRLLGLLEHSTTGSDWCINVSGRRYHALTASVTFFRGREGDEAVILVPEGGESKWAAIENIIHDRG
ncbi:MAG: hypothetical protein WC052_02515 [Patescibacteria group bacterium]|jgi:hypothetical protein